MSFLDTAPIEHQTDGAAVCTGDIRNDADGGRLGESGQEGLEQSRGSRIIVFLSDSRCLLELHNQWVSEYADGLNLKMMVKDETNSLHCSVGAPNPIARISTSDAVYTNIPLATRMEIAIDVASALAHLHSSWGRCIHLDIKPSNILLDSTMERNIPDFGLSRLRHAVPAPVLPGKPSAKRGVEIKIGSHMTHQGRYLSAHHPPLIQMLQSARKWSGDMLTSCVRSITTKRIFGMAEAGWVSAKPNYDTPSAGPVSEYSIRKLFGIGNGLTVNESQQHSDPDSSRSGHGKMAGNTNSSASWIVATAAPHHATGNHNLLSGFVMDHDDQFVHAVNRVPMKVLARGAVVTDALVLPDVWFVPGLTENLVSVSQLAELDHSIGFGRGECCIRSARDGTVVGNGRLQEGGHYVLDYLKVPLAI